jgi:hypothetical protein
MTRIHAEAAQTLLRLKAEATVGRVARVQCRESFMSVPYSWRTTSCARLSPRMISTTDGA